MTVEHSRAGGISGRGMCLGSCHKDRLLPCVFRDTPCFPTHAVTYTDILHPHTCKVTLCSPPRSPSNTPQSLPSPVMPTQCCPCSPNDMPHHSTSLVTSPYTWDMLHVAHVSQLRTINKMHAS